MSNEDYSPRRDDHLVEPMFAGLGVGDGEEEGSEEVESGEVEAHGERPGFWRRLWSWLVR